MGDKLQERVSAAVSAFWATRRHQREAQGSGGGARDHGARTAVTGGAQMDGFIRLMQNLLIENGLPGDACFIRRGTTELPGFFRATKQWDLLVVRGEHLPAAVEFKSQVGPSFGNNFNNRAEEAIGSAKDILTAYREGAFGPGPRPWLGYLMVLEECEASSRPVTVREPHFGVFEEFKDASYAVRYEILCRKLIRECLYDSACLLMSNRQSGPEGEHREPADDLIFSAFARSLMAKATTWAQGKPD